MQKTTRLQRLLAVVVAVFMAVCCLPLSAFAATGDPCNVIVKYRDITDANYIVESKELTLPEGYYSVEAINDLYVPEGYKTVHCSLDIAEGATVYVDVKPTVEKPATLNVNVTYYCEGEGYIGDGEQITIKPGTYGWEYLASEYLNVPDGYKLAQNGSVDVESDTLMVNVVKESVPSTPLEPATVTVDVSYYDEANKEYVGDGEKMTIKAGPYSLDYLVSEGYLHIPEGYKLVVYGNVDIESPTLVVKVEKTSVPSTPLEPATVKVDVSYYDEANNEYVGDGETMTIKAGPYSLDYLVAEGYLHIPEGYKLVVYGNVDIESSTLVVKVEKKSVSSTPLEPATLKVDVSYFDEASNEYVGKETMTIKAGPYSLDYLVAEGYLHIPEGYKLVVYGNVDIESPTLMVKVESTKTIRIIWSIDNDAASFANGKENTWTQELAWSHINDLVEMPEVTVPDGYVLKGWTIDGKALTGWDANVESFTVGRNYKEDENGGSIYITANIVAKDAAVNNGNSTTSSSDNNNTTTTTTATSTASNEVVKSAAPADNTTKVMPQTGLTAETPVVFGVMMFAALAGAGAYLFALRKKLN